MAYAQHKIKKALKGVALLLGLFILFILKLVSGQGGGDKTLTLSQKAQNILGNTPQAYADTPPPPGCGGGGGGGGGGGCSLLVTYWGGEGFKDIDIYSPRYYQPTLNTITVPKEAIQKDGRICVRVAATKRHKIYFAGLVAPKKSFSHHAEKFTVGRAYHKREEKNYAEVLNTQRSGEYLRTIPGDTVDVAFKVTDSKLKKSEQEAYLLEAGGVYVAASEEVQKEAGDWVNRLDLESHSFLKKLYSLNKYYDSNKKPVVP
ncbi:MAG: hypothetical protein HYT27_03600 [Parcubacteria group bacterium]|nr:hypothetical protein [Parcubacteria group bacterium]